jgi:hypothetical protein
VQQHSKEPEKKALSTKAASHTRQVRPRGKWRHRIFWRQKWISDEMGGLETAPIAHRHKHRHISPWCSLTYYIFATSSSLILCFFSFEEEEQLLLIKLLKNPKRSSLPV